MLSLCVTQLLYLNSSKANLGRLKRSVNRPSYDSGDNSALLCFSEVITKFIDSNKLLF